ncbi:MAG: 50S ribosomal protein L25 [Arhodomonas sp.]|nr:50S ribosomal protein L25 [Arhodomonas sp.]
MQRHPFKPLVTHLDFLRVRSDEKLRTHVPLHFLNEETAKGVKQAGGVIHHDMIEVEVECYPRDLPEYIEVDVEELDIDSALHLSDVTVPAGVQPWPGSRRAMPTTTQPVVSIYRAAPSAEGRGRRRGWTKAARPCEKKRRASRGRGGLN